MRKFKVFYMPFAEGKPLPLDRMSEQVIEARSMVHAVIIIPDILPNCEVLMIYDMDNVHLQSEPILFP